MKRIFVVLALMLVAANASAKEQLVDRIVAVVEDQAIFASDIETMVKQYMLQQGRTSMSDDERRELQQKVLNDLINDKLVIAEAGRLDVTVTFSDVEAQVNKAIDENKRLLGGEEAFERQLAKEGFTMDSLKKLYRDQVRNRMLVEKVLQMEMQKGKGQIGDEELHAFYEKHKDELPMRPEVAHLKTIFIGFQTSTNAARAAKEKIDKAYARIQAGESFEDVARDVSDDPTGTNGGDLGFLKPEDLRDPKFAAAVTKLDVGEVSGPVLTSYGYHLIKITDKRPDTGELRISHILVRVIPSDEDIQGVYETATEVRNQLVSGVPFDSLAARYNTDPTADAFGDLGWLKVADLPEFFRDVLAGMSPGDISQVLRESQGFRIVKLVAREGERPYEYSEITGELRQLYQQEYMSERYDDYVAGLRKKFNVDIKQ